MIEAMTQMQKKSPMPLSATVFQQGRRIRFLWLVAPVALAPALLAESGWPQGSTFREMLEFAGTVLILICIGGRCWASLYVGGRKNRELVTTGPYAYTRNPLYFFSALGLAGVGLTFGSLILSAFLFVFTCLVFSYVATREVVALDAMFGEAYRRYRRSVPAFFPRLRRDAVDVLGSSLVTFDSVALKRTAIDGSYFLAAILAVELFGWLQSAGLVTPMFRLF
ncbi:MULTISPECIES: isoprenylcysteine carboxylmethyltransferase family protein [unclassified Mesorhizobium]|nr:MULTISPECIES: isoprenylcysteine carboxylmethyltransferase family protein [unclassified Mesorhizobium]RUW70593.1 isoprenylcysteine carboxylmethyltransferase family protein [Mesorhizobium sp. M2A.F.Ca.ET.067.02.1.1]AZO04909.1 isoprenylcysteine carboxylmethyltransferase family protein [Mesorhizobium sp. M2A.F.Ca.ET.043.02.1.1]RUW30400.1 isoprenylcysteine carboxylmethyltransferase family protein [Mesorhizobium sp. M2A.F.Ca.ET.015.02.1.1]RVC97329.1 isoprenylcysteine carboxylmethyltransferase fami